MIKFKEYYLNQGIHQLQIVEKGVQFLNNIRYPNELIYDEIKIMEFDKQIAKIADNMNIAFYCSLERFSQAIEIDNAYKEAILLRAKLNSLESIWNIKMQISFIGCIKYQDSFPKNYSYAMDDYEKFLSFFITEEEYLDINIEYHKLKYKIFKDSVNLNLTYYDPWTKFLIKEQNRISFYNIYFSISKLIDKFSNNSKLIKFRAYYCYDTCEFIISDYYADKDNNWINQKFRFLDMNQDIYTIETFLKIGIYDLSWLIENDFDNAGDYYYQRGMLYHLIGNLNNAKNDFIRSKELLKKINLKYEEIIDEIIMKRIQYIHPDDNYTLFFNSYINDCACGENPCCCSDPDPG